MTEITKRNYIDEIKDKSSVNPKPIIKMLESINLDNNITIRVGKVKPTILDKGDVFYFPQLGHPVLIVKCLEHSVLALLLTTVKNTNGVISKAESRFFKCSYITSTVVEIKYKQLNLLPFIAYYQNDRHLTEVLQKVIEAKNIQTKLLESSYTALVTKYK